MVTPEFAERFAQHWVAAWNAHDLEKILSHYTPDFEMVSPYIVQITEQASGKLRGKAAVGAYWSMALDKMPHLHFDLISVLVGIDSVVINYHGARGLASEVFYFDDAGLVVRACAHYA